MTKICKKGYKLKDGKCLKSKWENPLVKVIKIKSNIWKNVVYSLLISISSIIADRLFHLIVFETIQGKPASTMPYYLIKLIVVFLVAFVILMFKKLNIFAGVFYLGTESNLKTCPSKCVKRFCRV